jgi:hypothetical protein
MNICTSSCNKRIDVNQSIGWSFCTGVIYGWILFTCRECYSYHVTTQGRVRGLLPDCPVHRRKEYNLTLISLVSTSLSKLSHRKGGWREPYSGRVGVAVTTQIVQSTKERDKGQSCCVTKLCELLLLCVLSHKSGTHIRGP